MSRAVTWVVPLVTIAAVVAGWEAMFVSGLVDLTFFPPPSQFGGALIRDGFEVTAGLERADLTEAAIASLGRVVAGLGLAFVLGLGTGVLVNTSDTLRAVLTPLIQLIAPIAPLAWVPLAIILFGASETGAVFIVLLGTYPLLAIAAAQAIEDVPTDLLEVARTLGAERRRLWTSVKLRSILPSVFLMLRLNLMGAWMALLAGETVNLRNGLGGIVIVGRESVSPDMVMSGVAAIAIVGFAMNQTLVYVEKRLFVERRLLRERSSFAL